jgi:hypothetical protein
MVPDIDFIARRIPPPQNIDETVCDIQTAEDIIACIVNSVEISKWYCNNYSFIFAQDNSVEETCEDIYVFMRENFSFNPETGRKQTGRSVRYIVYDPSGLGRKYFDCKHFSTFALATLKSLGIKCHLRLCGYSAFSNTPTHVYVVAYDERGKKIIVDGTLADFNRESRAKFIINVQTK